MGEEGNPGGEESLKEECSLGGQTFVWESSLGILRESGDKRETHMFWFKGSRALEAPENFITKMTICTAKGYTVLHTGE